MAEPHLNKTQAEEVMMIVMGQMAAFEQHLRETLPSPGSGSAPLSSGAVWVLGGAMLVAGGHSLEQATDVLANLTARVNVMLSQTQCVADAVVVQRASLNREREAANQPPIPTPEPAPAPPPEPPTKPLISLH
jgi:hypothetical protein